MGTMLTLMRDIMALILKDYQKLIGKSSDVIMNSKVNSKINDKFP